MKLATDVGGDGGYATEKLIRYLAPEYKPRALAFGQIVRFIVVVVVSSLQFLIINILTQQP
jgi:hypothetical protein